MFSLIENDKNENTAKAFKDNKVILISYSIL